MDWLQGIFDWLGKRIEPSITWLGDVVGRIKWFTVALAASVVTLIGNVISILATAAQFFSFETGKLYQELVGLFGSAAGGGGEIGAIWPTIQQGAALMNCVVPLDYALSAAFTLTGIWGIVALVRATTWLWSLIPFKAT